MMKVVFILWSLMIGFAGLSNSDYYLYYKYKIGFDPGCKGEKSRARVVFFTNSDKPVKISGFTFSKGEMDLYIDGEPIDEIDGFILKNRDTVVLEIESVLFADVFPRSLQFQSDLKGFEHNQIILYENARWISSLQIQNGQTIVIDSNTDCFSSLRLFFPFAGTNTFIQFKTKNGQSCNLPPLSYSFNDKAVNYVDLTKADVGVYKCTLSSCHWGDEFTLIIK